MSTQRKITPKVRCAIYTRKSTDEGLEMDFNSLDAQREACESFITSQKAEGWHLVPDRYDDGGFSGGNLERPGLKRLLTDIEAGKIDMVVIYKIDRLTRSLLDFSKLVERFDNYEVTFTSVTQSFNTATSMGRLTLNMLLSFAQFEREVTAERIRDKFAASKRKGLWMGGRVPLGYRVKDRKLVVVQKDAKTVQFIFERYLEIGSVTQLVDELAHAGAVSTYGNPMDKGYLYRLLKNRHYLGEIPSGDKSYPGEHDAIIEREIWDKAQALLASNKRKQPPRRRRQSVALLSGLIRCAHCDRSMSPSHSRKKGKLYRYYICQTATKTGYKNCPICAVPAGDIEVLVVQQVRQILHRPEMVVKIWREGKEIGSDLQESEIIKALQRLDPVWEELFPAEQQRLINLLVDRVELAPEELKVRLRAEGLDILAKELSHISNKKGKAA
ncbi:Resolvase, N-terminal domain [Magnetococcus marinus MC-1]|uniref:Resolvase, N-terminal domain n=1 Tax=Magnetococcus marinus (strain ATCC BAA-1437 / JCM 17883 / MC-1) TaxID=156889 RepID=A0L6Z5_MAGMM|nr:recombinase family protein [Magnetococcus marinus]ABK43738.1 Resolvase, N-terminal domain [Magnetococcus marinus MC-1]